MKFSSERGLIMLGHSVIIGFVAYLIMLYGLKQSPMRAENRSILLGSLVLAYMIIFGHSIPSMNALNRV